jgi:hypothetical protein
VIDSTPFLPFLYGSSGDLDAASIRQHVRYSGSPSTVVFVVRHIVDCLVKSDPTFDVKLIQIPNGLVGNCVEFVAFKRTIAALLLKRCPRPIPIFSRSVDLLGFFVVRWLIEERGDSLSAAFTRFQSAAPPGITKQKFRSALSRLYFDEFSVVRPPSPRADFVPKAERTERIASAARVVFEKVRPLIAHFGPSLTFSTIGQLTRRVVSLALKTPHEYVVLPEPKGLRCLLFVERCKVQRISESNDVASVRVELPFEFSLLEGYICMNDTIIVCDVRLYEREDVSHLPFVLRMALLDEALAKSAPKNVHMRPHFRLKETRKLIQKKVSNFPIRGLAITAINSELTSLVPAYFLWEYEPSQAPVVLIHVSFAGRVVLGEVIGPTGLMSMVVIDGFSPQMFALNGKLADIHVVEPPREDIPLMRAKFLKVSEKDRPWTREMFMQTFPDQHPLISQEELIALF